MFVSIPLCLPTFQEKMPRKKRKKVLTLGTFVLPAPVLSVTFLLHLSLFPRGSKSLSLYFRVAAALLWLTDTLHLFSKQRSKAQILTR